MNRGIWTLIGFLLFFTGVLALILMLVQLKLSFLAWMDEPSKTVGLILRLIMIFGGGIIMYWSKMDRSPY